MHRKQHKDCPLKIRTTERETTPANSCADGIANHTGMSHLVLKCCFPGRQKHSGLETLHDSLAPGLGQTASTQSAEE